MGEIIKLHPITRADGKAWEYKCNQRNSLQTIYVSHSSKSIEYLQFLRVDSITQEWYPSSRYGIVSGNKFNLVEFGPDEELTSVSGQHVFKYAKDGYVLKSITFGTDRSSYGPFGDATGDNNAGEFKFEMGRSFGGFHGTLVGERLESVGVFIRVV